MVVEMRSPDRYRYGGGQRNVEEEVGLRYLSPGAFTILSPEDNGIPPDPPRAPQPYRVAPKVKRNRNQAFAIIAEPIASRPGSRSPSPSGRVSPFRGRGFNPKGSRFDVPEEVITGPPPEDIRTSPLIFGERVTHGPPSKYRRRTTTTRQGSGLSQNQKQSKSLTNLSSSQTSPGVRAGSRYGRPSSRLSPISSQSDASSKIPRSRSTPPSRGGASQTNKTQTRPGSKSQTNKPKTASSTQSLTTSQKRPSSRPGTSAASSKTKPNQTATSTKAKTKTAKGSKEEINSSKTTLNKKGEDKEIKEQVESIDNNVEKPPPPIEVNIKERKPYEHDKISEESAEGTTSSSSPEKVQKLPQKNRFKGVRNKSSASATKREGSAASTSTTTSNKPESSDRTKDRKKKTIKLADLLPDNNSIVSTTTSTVGTPLKLEFEKIESTQSSTETEHPESSSKYGVDLTKASITSAMNKMNESVPDSKTVMASSSASSSSNVVNKEAEGEGEGEKTSRGSTAKPRPPPSEVLRDRKSYFSTKVKVFASFLGTGEKKQPMSRLTSASSIRSLVRGPSASLRRKPSASSSKISLASIGSGSTAATKKDTDTSEGAKENSSPSAAANVPSAVVLPTITDDDNESKQSLDLLAKDKNGSGSGDLKAKTLGLKGGGMGSVNSPALSHITKASPGKLAESPLPAVNEANKQSNNNTSSGAKIVGPDDVQPLKITVQERPNDGEVQSGNTLLRLPNSVSNGVNNQPLTNQPGFFHRVGKSFIRSFKSKAKAETISMVESQEQRTQMDGEHGNKKKENLCSRLAARIRGKNTTSNANGENNTLTKDKATNNQSRFKCCGKKDGNGEDGTNEQQPGCFACCRKRKSPDSNEESSTTSCFSCCGKKKRKLDKDNKENEDETKQGCFSCCRRKKKEGDKIKVNVQNPDGQSKGCWERMKCCKKTNKIGDKRKKDDISKKESWADRKDSILSEPPKRKKTCCGVMKSIFCCCCMKEAVGDDPLSRRISTNKSLTPMSMPVEDLRPKLDINLVEHSSTMKGAIPVLPLSLAWFCCVMNVIVPGTGTIFSGMFCLCMGKARFSQRDGAKQRIGSFIINLIIGFGQAFTVLFCLVGWGWSIWWGVIMIKMAKRQRKLKIIEDAEIAEEARQNQIAQETARRDIEKGRIT